MDAHHEHTSMLTRIEVDHLYAEDSIIVYTNFDEENGLNASFTLLLKLQIQKAPRIRKKSSTLKINHRRSL